MPDTRLRADTGSSQPPRTGGGVDPLVDPLRDRLLPHITASTADEREAHRVKYNYGDPAGTEDLERNQMAGRDRLAGKLDELATTPERRIDSVDQSCKYADIPTYVEQTLVYYVGPREQGHSIFIAVKDNIRTLVEDAFMKGLNVDTAPVQRRLAEIATEKALLESDGLGSAGRSDMRR